MVEMEVEVMELTKQDRRVQREGTALAQRNAGLQVRTSLPPSLACSACDIVDQVMESTRASKCRTWAGTLCIQSRKPTRRLVLAVLSLRLCNHGMLLPHQARIAELEAALQAKETEVQSLRTQLPKPVATTPGKGGRVTPSLAQEATAPPSVALRACKVGCWSLSPLCCARGL